MENQSAIDTNVVLKNGTQLGIAENKNRDEAIRQIQEFKARDNNQVWADTQFAQDFIDAYPDTFLYVTEEKQFLKYDQGRFIECQELPHLVHEHIKKTIWNVPSKKEKTLDKSLSDGQRQKILSIDFACKVVKALSHHPTIICKSTEFDTDPFLLNTPNSVV